MPRLVPKGEEMKILVTGGAGFLGSHVCELFKEKGWDVIAYDNLTKFEFSRAGFKSEIRDYNLKFLESIGVPTIVADIRDVKMLRKAAHHCDLIAHCAAQPAMTIAIESPQLDFDVNVQGFINVLETARYWESAVINCSTIHVYGNGLNAQLKEGKTRFERDYDLHGGAVTETEEMLTGALSPLHASKRTAELYVQAYIDTYHLPAANFRLTGIYGPRQFGGEDHGWVANFAIKTLLDQSLKVFGTDKQVRDILYVKDAARAFLTWVENGQLPGTYNIGGGEATATSILELLNLLEELTGKRSEVTMLPTRHGDLWWFVSDYSKACESFRWLPNVLPVMGIPQLTRWIERERSLFE